MHIPNEIIGHLTKYHIFSDRDIYIAYKKNKILSLDELKQLTGDAMEKIEKEDSDIDIDTKPTKSRSNKSRMRSKSKSKSKGLKHGSK